MSLSPAAKLANQLRPAVTSERVLAAVASIPRERFVPDAERDRAYDNVALPIPCGQTISQPLVVARMLETLDCHADDLVLDVGTGSGYHAALLALLAEHVWTIERHEELTSRARETIDQLGLDNVTFVVGDGWEGLEGEAPFDAINVAAATGNAIPARLEEQLAEGGRLVAPVGTADQHLMLTCKQGGRLIHSTLEPVRFVPLVRESPASPA